MIAATKRINAEARRAQRNAEKMFFVFLCDNSAFSASLRSFVAK
jgi:hypothetical protein